MKGFILDSTFKEISIIDNNNELSNITSNNLLNGSIKTYNIPLNKNMFFNISHYNNIDKINKYNLIDYI